MDNLRVAATINGRKYYYHCATIEAAYHLHEALSKSPIVTDPEIWEGDKRLLQR